MCARSNASSASRPDVDTSNNKSEPMRLIHILVPVSVLAQLDAEAAKLHEREPDQRLGNSRSAIIRKAIRNHVEGRAA